MKPPTARLVPESPGAAEAFDALEELKLEALNQADAGDAPLYLWGKAVENARRVALIVAALRRPKSPLVEERDARFASELVAVCVSEMVAYVREDCATSKGERISRDVIRCIKRNGGKIDKGTLTMQLRRYTRDERSDAIDDLYEAGRIVIAAERGTGAKKVTVYRLAAG